MLNKDVFKTVIDSVPLIFIDILVKKDDKILLSKNESMNPHKVIFLNKRQS
jgi:hypothetical protein